MSVSVESTFFITLEVYCTKQVFTNTLNIKLQRKYVYSYLKKFKICVLT